ncbi:MAG: DUF1275 family protein [Planctomycetota bacterium]|nr:DUF1275 family protein [Planctomycetota bacterium]
MLSAESYSFRQNAGLAISLSWVGGYTNVVMLLCTGRVISHMTGTTTAVGQMVGLADWREAKFLLLILLCFVAGAASSAFLTEWARRRSVRSRYALPVALEAVLLSALAALVAGHHQFDPTDAPNLLLLTGLASFSMGLQNATITKISGAVVRTTHLTGVVTDIGLEGMQLLLHYRDNLRRLSAERTGRFLRVSRRHPPLLRVLLLMSIFTSFLFGAIFGTLGFVHVPDLALLPPVTMLCGILFLNWFRPITDVQELDVLNDPELAGHGIVKTMLPGNVGIYRFAGGARGAGKAAHRAPRFEAWAARVPAHWQVIILAISRHTRFDDHAVGDLATAIDRLKRQGRHLVLSGVTPSQYKALEKLGRRRRLDPQNLCPDIEFAVGRAMAIAHGLEARGQAAEAPRDAAK